MHIIIRLIEITDSRRRTDGASGSCRRRAQARMMTDDVLEAEIAAAVVSVDATGEPMDVDPEAERREIRHLNRMGGASVAVCLAIIVLSATIGELAPPVDDSGSVSDGTHALFEWDEPRYLPRDPACIDPDNGQDPGYEGYGVGYEPSLSVDSHGNMFITAHKDLRWGGEETPPPANLFLGSDAGYWYACTTERDILDPNGGTVQTTWDYWASWFWISTDNGSTWGPGEMFEPTPGSSIRANYLAGASECLGDEGDISVDANDRVYYLDTTLEDNWWHIFSDGGTTYDSGACQRMNTMAADDRPWVAAQGDGIIHYLGNSGLSPPECTGDAGRYWYYHSEDGGNTFSQCYAVPGGWSTIASQRSGPWVHIAQENADTNSGTVHVRSSPDHGRGTGITDGTWGGAVDVGPRNGNCPEGYPVVNVNEKGTVAVVWGDCPEGGTGPWDMWFAISYDNGTSWGSWEITPIERGITMYPFVSISEEDVVALSFYGLDFEDGGLEGDYVQGESWYLYAAATHHPCPAAEEGEDMLPDCEAQPSNDTWHFEIADPTPLHNVTAYEESNGDVHALHDFFETVLAPDGSWMGIAYQQNVGEHPFEENEEQRYIKFVRGNLSF